jgi:uncharacterized protein (TIGR00730 family)
MKAVCVYCGSSDKIAGVYVDAAWRMGLSIAQKGFHLVYGAGSTGLMGAVADGALEAGGEVIGVIPEIFNTPQLAHQGISRFEVVKDMHARKARIVEISDGFIALPGGFGTLEELFEILTWAQIGLHAKPIGLLNTNGYYDALLTFFEQIEKEGFMYAEHQSLYLCASEPEELLALMTGYQPPDGLERWIDRG